VRRWSDATEIAARTLVLWLGLASSKFYDWRQRYGKVNEHNGWIPRDFWLEGWEKRAIIEFHDRFPLEGYRRLTFMMLDADVVAVSPSSVWRVLHGAGRLGRKGKPSSKGKGFQQPLQSRTSTGTWISPTLTSRAPSTTSAACWMATAATWCTGRFANR